MIKLALYVLPDSQGSLSAIVPSLRTEAVNAMVRPVIEEQIDGIAQKVLKGKVRDIFTRREG